MTAALSIFMRPAMFDVADNGLTTIPNINSFDANDLRAAVSQSAQRLRQDRESARQSACRRCRCQNVTVATVPATEPTEDGHRRRMYASHLNYNCTFGFASRPLALDKGQCSIHCDLRHPAVREARCGLELIQGSINELDRGRTERRLQPIDPCLAVTLWGM